MGRKRLAWVAGIIVVASAGAATWATAKRGRGPDSIEQRIKMLQKKADRTVARVDKTLLAEHHRLEDLVQRLRQGLAWRKDQAERLRKLRAERDAATGEGDSHQDVLRTPGPDGRTVDQEDLTMVRYQALQAKTRQLEEQLDLLSSTIRAITRQFTARALAYERARSLRDSLVGHAAFLQGLRGLAAPLREEDRQAGLGQFIQHQGLEIDRAAAAIERLIDSDAKPVTPAGESAQPAEPIVVSEGVSAEKR